MDRPLSVSLPTRQCTIEKISALKQVLARHPGISQVHLRLITPAFLALAGVYVQGQKDQAIAWLQQTFVRMRGFDARLTVEQLFSDFDPVPVAAASIGQVHQATLPNGRRVAVKVERPNAPRQVEADLALL